jgi:hypothetical protein
MPEAETRGGTSTFVPEASATDSATEAE